MATQDGRFNNVDTVSSSAVPRRMRVTQACDFCKRRKVKCDGAINTQPRCSTCISYDLPCTYQSVAKKRGPKKRPDVVHARKTQPTASERKSSESPGTKGSTSTSAFGGADRVEETDNDDYGPSSEDEDLASLSQWIANTEINPLYPRQYAGNSSPSKIIKIATLATHNALGGVAYAKRPEFWTMNPWETEQMDLYVNSVARHRYDFPDVDLIPILVDQYFAQMNIYFPVLHRPTFEKALMEGLHLRDNGFGVVLLLVCAHGSRFCDDPRVLLPGCPVSSAGWRWYNQAQMVRKSPLAPRRLYDVQQYNLAASFLFGGSSPEMTRSMIILGIDIALDVNAHRGKVYKGVGEGQLVEEQWKRNFWTLVNMDRSASCEMGRTLAILDDDIDAPLPRDCDDEFWDGPAPGLYFQQPSNKPTPVSSFVHITRLRAIQGYALRTLFSASRRKQYDWEERVVEKMDGMLASWETNIPTHLLWDPSQKDSPFSRQSAWIYGIYYYTKIMIHRPFVIRAHRTTPLGTSSLVVCRQAAKQLSRIMEVQLGRGATLTQVHIIPTFTAASFLLLSRFGDRTQNTMDEDMKDVYTCMTMLKLCETKWLLAGKYWDLLCEIITVNQLSAPAAIDASEEAIASWGNLGGADNGASFAGFADTSGAAPTGPLGDNSNNNKDAYGYVFPEELLLADEAMDMADLAYLQPDQNPVPQLYAAEDGAASSEEAMSAPNENLQSLFDEGVPSWTNWTRLLTGGDDTPPLPGSIS